MLEHARDRRRQRQAAGKHVRPLAPAREVHVTAGSFLPGCRLGEKARPHAHRPGELFDRELRVGGVVGRFEGGSGCEVELDQPWRRLGMHRRELDAQVVERRAQRADKRIERGHLARAVADPTRDQAIVFVAQAHLVFDRRHRVISDVLHLRQHAAQDFAGCELAASAVRPARGAEADPPAWSPAQVMQRRRVWVHHKVGGSRADAEPFVIGDRHVDGIQRQQEVRHHRAVPHGGVECVGSQRLAPQRAVDVWDHEQHELDVLGRSVVDRARRGLRLGVDQLRSFIVAANLATISSSSSSVLVRAGAKTTSSPA